MSDITSSTIDKEDMEGFDKYVNVWWEENGPAKFLHAISKLVTPYVKESLIKAKLTIESFAATDGPLKDVRILDGGCGGGIICEALAKLGATVVGLHVNSNLIDVATAHASLSQNPPLNLTYVLEAVEDHVKINCGKYDAVISNFVVEHINEVEIYLKACVECVKPGGLIFVSTIGQTLMGWLLGITLPEHTFNLFPKGSHDYDKFINLSDMEKMLKKANCVTNEKQGILFETNQFSWFWIDDTSAYYMIQSVKQ